MAARDLGAAAIKESQRRARRSFGGHQVNHTIGPSCNGRIRLAPRRFSGQASSAAPPAPAAPLICRDADRGGAVAEHVFERTARPVRWLWFAESARMRAKRFSR